MNVKEEIIALKKKREAVILAHNYVPGEIQDIADFTGDSLELSRKAAQTGAGTIVFCGVRFMAETAKILSPSSTVLLPVAGAGCAMADMALEEDLVRFRRDNPGVVAVAYVNTTAAVKKHVDICCTSGNVHKVISSIPTDREILFLPDANLGANVSKALSRRMTLWKGCCPVHDSISPEMVLAAKKKDPAAEVLVHPECRPEVVALADRTLSTGGMLSHVSASERPSFIIVTEEGILHRLSRENPGKTFHPVSPRAVCRDMKLITLESVRDCLEGLSPRIELDAETTLLARRAIDRMLAL